MKFYVDVGALWLFKEPIDCSNVLLLLILFRPIKEHINKHYLVS